VRSITVSLLASECEGLKQLEQSVLKITTEVNNLNKADVRREIDRYRSTIDQLHDRIGAIDRKLTESYVTLRRQTRAVVYRWNSPCAEMPSTKSARAVNGGIACDRGTPGTHARSAALDQ
jgi:hypothetical protein